MLAKLLYISFLSTAAFALPAPQASKSFTLQNGQLAISLNQQYANLTADSPCTAGQTVCVNNSFAQCMGSKYVLTSCGLNLICGALPLINSAGAVPTCTTKTDLEARIAATGASDPGDNSTTSSVPTFGTEIGVSPTVSIPSATSGEPLSSTATSSSATDTSDVTSIPSSSQTSVTASVLTSSNATSATVTFSSSSPEQTVSSIPSPINGTSSANNTLQNSLSLDPSLVQKGFFADGKNASEGIVASLTSKNNFINFCATVPHLPLTNGKQILNGSCNAAPMGVLASVNNMPSCKFASPRNLNTIKANATFTIKLAINHMNTGHFANTNTNFHAAPQTVDKDGDIMGHTHIVIERLTSLQQTEPTDPKNFVFFMGVNTPAQNGFLTANVTGGVPAGFYKLSSVNAAMNHQPALVAVAQRGALDDQIYFTATVNGTAINSGSNSESEPEGDCE